MKFLMIWMMGLALSMIMLPNEYEATYQNHNKDEELKEFPEWYKALSTLVLMFIIWPLAFLKNL